MKRHWISKVGAVALVLIGGAVEARAKALKPNIVLIYADDLGYADIGAYGQKKIATPNIDRLAREGVKFTSAYTAAPVCAPARCGLMTGLHMGHARIRGNAAGLVLKPEDQTLAKAAKSGGYQTALIGKWGLGGVNTTGGPLEQGWDYFYGFTNQTHAHNSFPTYLLKGRDRVKLENVVPNEGRLGQGNATVRKEFVEDLFNREALSFLDRVDASKPFFLYYASTAPHANNEAKAIDVGDEGQYADQKDWPVNERRFAALVTRLDASVGSILDKLKERGLADNTLVIFTSDNGPHKEGSHDPEFFDSNGQLRGIKRALYEGGIRVPFIARWPGRISAGAVNDQPVVGYDLLATVADLAGTDVSKTDGVSLLPALAGKELKRERPLYWEFYEGGFTQAAREERWKLVKKKGQTPELYDLSTDVGETNNVASQHPQVVEKLAKFVEESHVFSPDFPLDGGGRRQVKPGEAKPEAD